MTQCIVNNQDDMTQCIISNQDDMTQCIINNTRWYETMHS